MFIIKRIRLLFGKIVPDYAVWPIFAMLFVNALMFFGTRLITDRMPHYNFSGLLDYCMPFMPVFVIPYFLAFGQWIIGYLMIAHGGKDYCHRVMGGEIISKVITGIIFIILPTTMLRQNITGNDLMSLAVAFLYKVDPPTNLFPSIHCLESYICMKSAIELKNTGKIYRISMVVMSVLVFLSTLFIKQHIIMDFVGAVIVAEAGRLLAELIYKKHNSVVEKRKA